MFGTSRPTNAMEAAIFRRREAEASHRHMQDFTKKMQHLEATNKR